MNGRRLAPLVLAGALLAGACGDGSPGRQEARTRASEVGGWDTWVLSSGDQITVPPPPTGARAEAEADEVVELAEQRDADMAASIARWDDQPVGAVWQELHLEVVAERAKDPLQASRGYALMSVAVYDAVVSSWHWKDVYGRAAPGATGTTVGGADPSYPSEHAAVAGAASRLLAYLNPELPAARFDEMAEEAAMSRVWAGANHRSDVEAGLQLGRQVADEVIAYAEADGSHDAWDGSRPAGIATAPAFWAPPPGAVSPPTQPLGGTWDTWVLGSGDQLRPPPPPPYGSPEFTAQAREVLAVSAALTPEQKAVADRWAGGQGTPLPPGIWTQIALDSVRSHDLGTPEAARALALVGIAQADAGVSCWDAKFTYWYPRPVNAIRDSGLDPGWEPYLRTPLFPSYTSGHASYSGAASEVLAHLFPDQADELRAEAEEAARSRLYGGIHYPMDNEVGLAAGREIGRMVLARAATDGSSS